MKICHVCGETFEDYVEVCSDCGAVLKTEEEMEELKRKEREEAEKLIKSPTLLATVDSVIIAEIFADSLKEANIPFYCDEENAMVSGFGGNFFAVKVFVDEKDVAAAAEIYKNVSENALNFEDGDFFDDESDDGE